MSDIKILQSKKEKSEALEENMLFINYLQELIDVKKILLQPIRIWKARVYTARFNFTGLDSFGDNLLVNKGDEVEMYSIFPGLTRLFGRSLTSGLQGEIPFSYVESKLNTLMLFQFAIYESKLSYPTLCKIRNDFDNDDEKASLFMETLNDDPIMLDALRQDITRYNKTEPGKVEWHESIVLLECPSPAQCEDVTNKLNDIDRDFSIEQKFSPHSALILLSAPVLRTMMLHAIVIYFAPLPHDCIQCLCQILSSSKTIRKLCIIYYSIGDKGVISLSQAIVQNCNSTLSRLDLSHNPLITSACAEALCELILATDRIWGIDLRVTMMSSESVLLLLQALSANKSVRRLMLDVKHKKTFTETYTEYHPMMERLVFAEYYSYDYL